MAHPVFHIDAPSAPGASAGDTVYEQLLLAVQRGRLQAGQRLNDQDIARQLGVSRTPVREALLRLRELGVLETSPARYTRVATIDREQTLHAVAAWVTNYAPIAAEAAARGVPAHLLRAMRTAHRDYARASRPFDIEGLSVANAAFYDQPLALCSNPLLLRCADSVIHLVRLGLTQLPRPLNPQPLQHAQADLLSALRAHDPRAARRAVYAIAQIPL